MRFFDLRSASRILIPAVVAVSALLLPSCMKKEKYSIVPEIAYQRAVLKYGTRIYPDSLYLTISFKDGDGDIGFRSFDTFPPFNKGSQYYYNYIIDYYELQNGVFVKKVFDTASSLSFSARIPSLTPNYPDKAIHGTILNAMDFTLLTAPEHDTIMLKYWIYDRALHRSNIDSTPPIILKKR